MATKLARKIEFARQFLGKKHFSWVLYQVLKCTAAIKVIHLQIMFTFTCTET
jgi:phosphodiesterase/alkaline phosphatase D-like protein